jgi:hypothetical protein
MSNWWEKAPIVTEPDPLSAAAGRAAAERSGDPRFAPPPAAGPDNDSWWKMAPVARDEDPMRIATSVPQGVNAGLYKGVMALPDMSAMVMRSLGLTGADAPLPSQRIHDFGNTARDQAGITYNPNIIPETTGERIGFQVGDAVGQVASTAVPGSIVAKTAAPAVAGMRVAAPTYGQTVAQTLATQPGMQLASNVAGNLTTEFTGSPYLGLGASFALPAVAHAAHRIPFSAPATTGSEAERRALLADAKKEGILPSFGNIQDSWGAKIFESVVGKLPFMGGVQTKINEGNKAAFNAAALNKITQASGQGLDAATTGTIDSIKAKIGGHFDNLQNQTTVRIDPQFGSDIAKAKLDISKQLRDQIPENILNKLDELQTAATAHNQPGVTATLLDGETYKNIRSKLSAQLANTKGTDTQAVVAMIDALDGAVERSLPRDMVKDWQNARLGWRRITTIEDAVKGRHSGETGVGNIPPGSLEARAGSDKEMRRLATVGVKFVGDKMPDSGTASRMLIQNGLGLGAGAGAGYQFPLTTAVMGAIGYGGNLMMNNPYTRAFLVNRLQNSREGVLNKGLVATLAAQQAADQNR